jgi:hypothetical protein
MQFYRHCEERSGRSNPSIRARRYGLLRGACHRARVRATRWLAMTMWKHQVRQSNPTDKSANPILPARCVASHASQISLRRMRQNNATGKSEKPVQCARQKYSSCRVGQISDLNPPVSPDKRGGSRSSRNARWDAVDADAPLTNGTDADGEVVWSWRRDAGVKFVRSKCFAGATVARKPVHRGEREVSRKPWRGESPDVPAHLWSIPCAFVCKICRTGGRGCQPAPGFPCALFSSGGPPDGKTRTLRAARMMAHILQLSSAKAGDPVRRGLSAQASTSLEYFRG